MKIGFMGAVVDYEYVPGPFRQDIKEIDWADLTSTETNVPHIRIQELEMEPNVAFNVATNSATLAVVIVNTKDHFRYGCCMCEFSDEIHTYIHTYICCIYIFIIVC